MEVLNLWYLYTTFTIKHTGSTANVILGGGYAHFVPKGSPMPDEWDRPVRKNNLIQSKIKSEFDMYLYRNCMKQNVRG